MDETPGFECSNLQVGGPKSDGRGETRMHAGTEAAGRGKTLMQHMDETPGFDCSNLQVGVRAEP